MTTFRLQLRFLLPLVLALVAGAYLAAPAFDRLLLRWFARDLNSRGVLVANALSDSAAEALATGRTRALGNLFERAVQDERLFAIALCDKRGEIVRRTEHYPADLGCAKAEEVAQHAEPRFAMAGGPVHVGSYPVVDRRPPVPAAVSGAEFGIDLTVPVPPPDTNDGAEANGGPRPTPVLGRLVLLHDLSFIERRSQDTRRYLVALIAGLGLVIAFLTMLVAQLSWRGWVNGARALLRGEVLVSPFGPAPELAPIAEDLRTRLRDLEDEFRRSHGRAAAWSAESLRGLLQTELHGDQVIVVSNREPYIHERTASGAISVRRPASGLVTAVEPVMRACSGTWIAHGSGSADRDVVDLRARVAVPPGHDDYFLRRIWLTAEEEQGYYYGFANEGLWPLCHVAHVRPVFRESDWRLYRAINERFADAVVAEARTKDPVVLVQDYHFALLPRMIRERLPLATVLTFWHIPWPNPESFGICPWRRELLEGLLGSTILGFHTPYHCNNFIATVDRTLEARIEHEHSTITFQGKPTLVESYPISIEWPADPGIEPVAHADQSRRAVLARLQLPANVCLAVGIDRYDYTKGIVERFQAVERLLELHPGWIGRFVLVQVAAPTRSSLDEYRGFQQRAEQLAHRINERFGTGSYAPIRLLARHHEPEQVNELLRAADVCVVTSLHDGMNLVCKEFVAARADLRGVLVLSRFAGAARELTEALVVNPYHVEETADALHRAATMPAAEQRERMGSLRATVREHNVYRWAGRMLADAGRLRLRARIEDRVRRLQQA